MFLQLCVGLLEILTLIEWKSLMILVHEFLIYKNPTWFLSFFDFSMCIHILEDGEVSFAIVFDTLVI